MAISQNLMAFNAQWDKLLHYESSYPTEKYFYLSPDRESEVERSLEAIKNEEKVGRLKKIFACSFPARYKLLQKYHSELKDRSCPELQEWQKDFSATNLYLVYSSSYPNNPASIFGHTFLRFDRKVENEKDSDLRGYSVAFMATTDPNDSSLSYTFKGLTGGYDGHLVIQPYYINIGIYNNSESRDLWEYQIPLKDEEREVLVLHLWEFMHNTGFPYYFLDDNCSWMMLKLLEVARPSVSFNSNNDIFIIPQETIKEAVKKFKIDNKALRESLGKTIERKFSNLSFKDQRRFKKAYKDEEELKKIDNFPLLEVLALEWKLTNYKKHTNLSPNEKHLFMLTHQLLSTQEIRKTSTDTYQVLSGPEKSHAPHLSSIFLAKDIARLSLRYGLNDIHDPPIGNPTNSYINFFGLDFSHIDNEYSLESIKIVDIKSLEDYKYYYPKVSWFGRLSFHDLNNKNIATAPVISAGAGLSKYFYKFRVFVMPGVISWYAKNAYELEFLAKLGATYNKSKFNFSLEYDLIPTNHKSIISSHTVQLGYIPSTNHLIALKHEMPINSRSNNFGLEYKFYY